MKHKNSTSMGALHPILFFAGVYIVALFLSIFICSTIFYSLDGNADATAAQQKTVKTSAGNSLSVSGVAVR